MYNYGMDIFLLIVILLQFGFIVYSDIQNRKERDLLQVKLMSKDLDDYKSYKEETPQATPEGDDPYIDIEEAGVEKIVKSKEKK